jgi:hypothetical protein
MEELQKSIERSARLIFKHFFKSRLYLRKDRKDYVDDFMGVNMQVRCKGDKRISLLMEKNTAMAIMESLSEECDPSGEDVAYDIISEMANMITGSAISRCTDESTISSPKRLKNIPESGNNYMNFTSRIGRFSIVIENL